MKKDVYRRPDKPAFMPVSKRQPVSSKPPVNPAPIIAVDRATECHVTPMDVAHRMVDYLEAAPGMRCLEPQAGTGNLVQALIDGAGEWSEIVAVERHAELCAGVGSRFSSVAGLSVVPGCFLEFAAEQQGIGFQRIVMNPPFRGVRAHMAAALSLLKSGPFDRGLLVALVPITYQHENAEILETLDVDTFSSTSVHTKLIRIEESSR